ncbi:N-terminal cleavage protein [Opitutaceae bacterium TAV5]|nr:N-terminal cleavage protein [Opitutaceae bacterium TAV5]
MKTCTPPPVSRRPLCPIRAFTLIELLTVIAIIGILAAIIIPVVGKVRQSAKAATCTSNLRQIGVAFTLYRNDNKGMAPPPLDSFNNNFENRTVWGYGQIRSVGLGRLQYEGYLNHGRTGVALLGDVKSKIFHCPSRDAGGGWAYDQTTHPDFIDYAYLISGDRYKAELDSGTAIATDTTGGDNQKAGQPIHGENANVLRADGSVHKVKFSVYSDPDRKASSFDRRSP